MYKTLTIQLAAILVSTIFLSACTNKIEDYSLTYDSEDGIGVEAQKNDVQIRGKLISDGPDLYLLMNDNKRVRVNSYLVSLSNMVGQRVSLVGEYRGEVFYVRQIE
jgi:hypothetical protein